MDKLEKILMEDAAAVNKKVDLGLLCRKNIIITGASGLIGINLLMSIKAFALKIKDGDRPQVTAVVFSGFPDHLRKAVDFKGLSVKKGDIADPRFASSLPQADIIIHAAGYGQPGKFMQDKVKTVAINTSATISLLEKLKPDGRFLFISSSEVYSGLSNPPYKEDQIGTTDTRHPRSCYIEGKRCGEAICNIYFEKGLNIRSARLSLAFGPGTKPGDMRVLNSFIEKGLNGKIELMDRGEAKRTYCYISDAVEIMWDILLSGKEPIYNVGGFSRTTIAGLAKKIGHALKTEVIIPKDGKRLKGAPDDVRLDMSKAAKEFGKLKGDFVDFDKGLARTIEWQKELYK